MKQASYIGLSYCILCSSTILKTDWNKHFCFYPIVLLKFFFQRELSMLHMFIEEWNIASLVKRFRMWIILKNLDESCEAWSLIAWSLTAEHSLFFFSSPDFISEIKFQLIKFFSRTGWFRLINAHSSSLSCNPIGIKIIIHTTGIAYCGLLPVLYLVSSTHVRVSIRGLKMLVFRKILRTYLIEWPLIVT